MVRVGAVDCDQHKDLAATYKVKGFPTIKIFASNKREPIDYAGVCAFFIPSSSPPPSPPITHFWECMYCIRATVLYLILECFIDEFLLGVRFNTFLQLLKPLQMPDHFMPLLAGPFLSDAMYHFGPFIPLSTHTHTHNTLVSLKFFIHTPSPSPSLLSFHPPLPPLCLKMSACSYHRSKNS